MADLESNPAVLRRRLRTVLQSARQDNQLTQAEAARHLGWSASKLLRIENGKHGVSADDLEQLMQLYGITDPQRTQELWTTAKAASAQRAIPVGRGITTEYRKYLMFERSAAVIRQFEPLLIPGHLQTAEYAHTVIRGLSDATDSDASVAERVAGRLANRDALLDRPEPPRLHFIIDEATIHRRIGGAAVMTAQLTHLRELNRRPNIDIQVVPFELGVHPGLCGPFILLEFPGSEESVLYREHAVVDQLHQNDAKEIRDYTERFQRLAEAAAPAAWFERIIDDAIAAMTPFRVPLVEGGRE